MPDRDNTTSRVLIVRMEVTVHHDGGLPDDFWDKVQEDIQMDVECIQPECMTEDPAFEDEDGTSYFDEAHEVETVEVHDCNWED